MEHEGHPISTYTKNRKTLFAVDLFYLLNIISFRINALRQAFLQVFQVDQNVSFANNFLVQHDFSKDEGKMANTVGVATVRTSIQQFSPLKLNSCAPVHCLMVEHFLVVKCVRSFLYFVVQVVQ